MKKSIAAILPLLVLSAAPFAQETAPPEHKPAVAAEKAPAAAHGQNTPAATAETDALPGDSAVGAAVGADTAAVAVSADTVSVAAADTAAGTAYADSAEAEAEEPPQSYRMSARFEENSLDLTPLSSAALDSMSLLFAKHKNNRYEVHGYSCPYADGPNSHVRLSAQRVERIVYHLLKLGVPGENILTVVNAPKSSRRRQHKECTEDRQVDVISSGMRWRDSDDEPETPAATKHETAVQETPAVPTAAPATAAAPETPAPKAKPIAADSGKQIVAVYMAGEEPKTARGAHTIMGGELARVMSESDKYTAVDRTEAILEQLDREQAYQHSGAVDDNQIKAIGHQLGVEFLCISNINPVGKRFYLDTRLVNVVTAEIARSVTATSTLKDANEMTRIGREIALELLEADLTHERRARRKKMFRTAALSIDAVSMLAFAYGIIENSNVVKHVNNIDGPEATRAATRRDVAYIVSGSLLGAGLFIHIVF